ncbi:hypothetical protein GWI33_016425 [Rhynchophorus ferrugineus]|uniref:Exonuclease domain-containing protein n=1 Tax=Rhynchophorus ferrugineus TaxID=354439 RepID=A0A834MAD7_RHYFE|nr:hypothetical protein GWI33_016425 [Rhynchophorus ferrugineus]
MEDIQTFVFMDLETTGLPDHLSLGVFKRVQNRLTLSFNPCKLISSESEIITGLSNEALENMGRFSEKTVKAINLFLGHHPQPVCLVAHNGDGFDYPILQRAIQNAKSSLNEGVLCIDSLKMFAELLQDPKAEASDLSITTLENKDEFDNSLEPNTGHPALDRALMIQKINETTPKKRRIDSVEDTDLNSVNLKRNKQFQCRRKLNFSLKLEDIYQRITKKTAANAHNADYDNSMTLVCVASLGDKFIEWANKNAKRFQEVIPMTPGRKLGQK